MSYSVLQLQLIEEAADRLTGQQAVLQSHAVAAAISACLSKQGNKILQQFEQQTRRAYDARFRNQ